MRRGILFIWKVFSSLILFLFNAKISCSSSVLDFDSQEPAPNDAEETASGHQCIGIQAFRGMKHVTEAEQQPHKYLQNQ